MAADSVYKVNRRHMVDVIGIHADFRGQRLA